MGEAAYSKVTLVLKNGAQPAGTIPQQWPFPQSIGFAQWEDGEVHFDFFDQAYAAAAIPEGAAFFLIGRVNFFDPDPAPLSVEAVVTNPDGGEDCGYFPIPSSINGALSPEQNLIYDVYYQVADGTRQEVLPSSEYYVKKSPGVPNTPVNPGTPAAPLGIGPQGVPQKPVARTYSGDVASGSFVKTTSTPGVVSQLLTTGADNPLYRSGIAVVAGSDGDVGNVVQVSGQQVTMSLDAGADAVCGQFAYYSQLVDGYVSALFNGLGPAGIFQTNGAAGTTADILS